jgi:hypothetical protein
VYENLCEPWPITWCGDISTVNPEVTGTAWQAASEILWEATGRRFGNCPVTVRPCRQECGQFPIDTRTWSGSWVDSGWPWPGLINGQWINLACGRCLDNCSCTSTSEVILPDPFYDPVVTVDGVTLTRGVDYQVRDGQRLVRLGSAEWPLCQDFTVVTGSGVFTLTARFGEPVPELGKIAIGVLTLEIAKACCGQPCGLPPSMTRVIRQGVTMEKPVSTELLKEGWTGLMIPDRFIATNNPSRISDRARAFSPDVPYPGIFT